MIRRPPRSTLFPTRRSSDLEAFLAGAAGQHAALLVGAVAEADAQVAQAALAVVGATCASRSEEHTSELQSRRDLVCRLLLEKKKKIQMIYSTRRIITSTTAY